MLTREKGIGIVFLCDGKKCNEFLETETNDFEQARELLNEDGWSTRKKGEEWLHTCPICLAGEYQETL